MAADSPLAGVMDNPYYDWSPIVRRPKLTWPGSAPVALGVLVTLEHMAWYPPEGSVLPASVRSSRAGIYPDVPDIHSISQWEYGNRVGVFRVVDVLARHGIRPVVAMDVTIAERAPFLVEHLQRAGAEFVGHGISSEQMVTTAMPENVERQLIADTLSRLSAVTGAAIRGWHGSEYSESARTLELLAAAGLDYTLDWPNDEQPVPMKVPEGRMLSLPVAVDLDDHFSVHNHHITVRALKDVTIDYFDRMYVDGAENGRLLMLNVHPWLTGQPFRIRYFAESIAHICGHDGVWKATGSEIADWYRSTRSM